MARTKKTAKNRTAEEKKARSKASGEGHRQLEDRAQDATDAINALFARPVPTIGRAKRGRSHTNDVLRKLEHMIIMTEEGKAFAKKLKEMQDDMGFKERLKEIKAAAKEAKKTAKASDDDDFVKGHSF